MAGYSQAFEKRPDRLAEAIEHVVHAYICGAGSLDRLEPTVNQATQWLNALDLRGTDRDSFQMASSTIEDIKELLARLIESPDPPDVNSAAWRSSILRKFKCPHLAFENSEVALAEFGPGPDGRLLNTHAAAQCDLGWFDMGLSTADWSDGRFPSSPYTLNVLSRCHRLNRSFDEATEAASASLQIAHQQYKTQPTDKHRRLVVSAALTLSAAAKSAGRPQIVEKAQQTLAELDGSREFADDRMPEVLAIETQVYDSVLRDDEPRVRELRDQLAGVGQSTRSLNQPTRTLMSDIYRRIHFFLGDRSSFPGLGADPI